jgi:hypothetical protein
MLRAAAEFLSENIEWSRVLAGDTGDKAFDRICDRVI